MLTSIKRFISNYSGQLKSSFKWILFAIITGVILGLVATAFCYALSFAQTFRECNPWLILLLPAAGLAIVAFYHLIHDEKDGGTNLILSSIHSNENIPLRMAPAIFLSTFLTHLFGGSSGREGAALQLGGSIGHALGKLFRFDEKDRHIMVMCGMSAAFSALFGTPLAAAVFSMEVVSVGIMQYAALVPCVISALIAHAIAVHLGIVSETMPLGNIPDFDLHSAVIIGILAVVCALASILFCVILHNAERFYKHFFKNTYVRVMVGGFIVIGLTMMVGAQTLHGSANGNTFMLLISNQLFNGTGLNYIAGIVETGTVIPMAFLLKMIFTAATLGCGYKGGEIVPSLFIGASLGCFFGNLVGFSPTLCAAVAMGAVFCGVTNSPITALLICFELFGFDAMPYYLLAIALSYMFSGYYGLYSSQKIIYSKYKAEYINKKTNTTD